MTLGSFAPEEHRDINYANYAQDIAAFVEYYNHQRYHGSLQNLTR